MKLTNARTCQNLRSYGKSLKIIRVFRHYKKEYQLPITIITGSWIIRGN
jgi:predicted ATPase